MRAALILVLAASLFAAPTLAQSNGEPARTAKPTGIAFGWKMAIDNAPCCASSRGAPSTFYSDNEIIASIPDRATRDRGILKLKLAGNKTLRIADCDEQLGCSDVADNRHRLVAWWPGHRYYVVRVILYEELAAYLVREADGLVVRVAAPPVLSPNGRLAIAWDGSLLGGPSLDLIDMTANPPEIRDVTSTIACPDRAETAHPGPKPTWTNNATIVFEGSELMTENSPHFAMTLRNVASARPSWQCHL